jgi:DNA-binding transcriptional ArsR family regulator
VFRVADTKVVAKLKIHVKLTSMSEQTDISYMASLYMALADQTRLRLLLKMYGGEVCVGDFTHTLGDSQPKISRHLAYLRNAGIVNTRRDGKWIHYSIRWPEREGGRAMLRAALDWLAGDRSDTGFDPAKRDVEPSEDNKYRTPIDIYENADMTEVELESESLSSAHNELEEFLL